MFRWGGDERKGAKGSPNGFSIGEAIENILVPPPSNHDGDSNVRGGLKRVVHFGNHAAMNDALFDQCCGFCSSDLWNEFSASVEDAGYIGEEDEPCCTDNSRDRGSGSRGWSESPICT